MQIAVDIGGTFTDIAVHDPATGRLTVDKVLTTPADLAAGVLDGLAVAGAVLGEAELLVHGSTVAINALLERRGACTALVTTAGFRDVYEIGRVNRPESFNLSFRKHRPLVPRERVHEVAERVLADGTVRTPLDERAAHELAERLRADGVGAVAVVFLHSYAHPGHEQRMAEILREACGPDVFVTASSTLSREYREFERTSTAAANAYVGPAVSGYLTRLHGQLGDRGFGGEMLLMQSNGGLCDVATASTQCIQMIESGPAGGVQGTVDLARRLGLSRAIYFDMGGTTAKACVVSDGAAQLSGQYFVGGYAEGLPIQVPVLDIVEVGTGGGSLAWLDEAGGLHVGPRSAGADPGPACYGGGGTQPTVTDAHVVLGHLSPARFLDGRMRLDAAAAAAAVRTHVADPLGIGLVEAAQGILAIADAAMANAVRAVTTERGLDPRDFTLVAAGGAGPMHAVAVAAELGVTEVVVPYAPGTFSAVGMLTADLRRDYVRTHRVRLDADPADLAALESVYAELERHGRADLGHRPDVRVVRSADVRYVGQEHTVTVPVPGRLDRSGGAAQLKADFDAAHGQRFSHHAPDEPAELVSLRLSVLGPRPPVALPRLGPPGEPGRALLEARHAVLGTHAGAVEVIDRTRLGAGDAAKGPALVEEAGSCLVLPPGAVATAAGTGELRVEVPGL